MLNPNQVHDTLKKHILADGYNYVFDFDESEGCYLYDSLRNKKILDCFGQFGSLPLGYNHPKILNNIGHLTRIADVKVANSDMYSTEMAEFVETFATKAVPANFSKLFFIEGGSAAVENALKVAFDWYSQIHNLTDEQAQNLNVIHLQDAFHGRGGYTLSLTNTTPDKTDYFPRFKWSRVLNPKILPLNKEETIANENISLAQIENAMKSTKVAAFIMETIQSEGGHNMFRKEYFQAVRKLCDAYGALFILDEVQTGFGASGKWWCYENYCVIPDIIVFGKKSQVCGIACNMDKIGLALNNCFVKKSRINSTWGGNIVDMVRSKVIIEAIDDKLLNHVATTGQYFLNRLHELPIIDNIRGIGTLIAFDMPSKEYRNALIEKLSDDIILLGCGDKTVRFRPALIFSNNEVDLVIKFIKDALTK